MNQMERTAKLSIQMPGFSLRARIRAARTREVGSASRRSALLAFAAMLTALALFLLVAMLLVSFFGASAQAATRAKLGEIPAAGGAGAGALSAPRSLAVNGTGAGGVGVGDIYILDGNNRVSQFSAARVFVRAFGYDVVESGEGNTGGAEICQAVSSPTDVCKAGTATALAGGLSVAHGIAVDQTTGNVYVYENGSQRVSIFSAKGVFQGAFGWKVKAGGEAAAALQFCTTAGTGCQAGEGTASAGGFGASSASPRRLSIDSSGNLYVPDAGNLRVDIFSLTLNGSKEVTGVSFVRAIGWKVNATTPEEKLQECTILSGCLQGSAGAGEGQFRAENPTSTAVDASGSIYTVSNSTGGACSVIAPCRIQKFNSNGTIANANFGPATGECATVRTSAFTTGPSGSGVQTVAVDPATGHVFALMRTLGPAARICELDATGAVVSVFPASPFTVGTGAAAGLAIGAGERVYAVNGGAIQIFGPVAPPAVEILPVTQIGQTSAKLNGKVTIPSPGGEGFNTTYRFEVSGDGGFEWTKVPSSDVAIGNGEGGGESSTCPTPKSLVCNVSQVATGLQPNLAYLVRLVATTGPSAISSEEQFKTLAAPPTVTYPQISAALATDTTAKLKGFVNPNNLATSYRFEYVDDGTYSADFKASGKGFLHASRVPDFDPFIGAGGQPIAVSANLSSLKPGTVYHYRVVASSAQGTTTGDERQFTTAADREALNGAGLPDNRGIELVSPADKRPIGLVGTSGAGDVGQVLARAAEDGRSFLYPMMNGTASSDAGGYLRELADRTDSGWLRTQVSPPSLVPPPDLDAVDIATPSSVRFSSPDLSCALIQTYNPLTEDTPVIDVELGVYNLYRWSAEDGSYELISNRVPLNGSSTVFDKFEQIDASDDCSRVYFRSGYEFIDGASGLYEWDEGTLRDAGVLPNGAAGSGVVMGGETIPLDTARWNAVSPDGSRLFFSAISNAGPDSGTRAVFARLHEVGGGIKVVNVSQPQPPVGVATTGARFEAASEDGSHVVFRANYGITATTGSGGPSNANCAATTISTENKVETLRCDLYDYEVDTGELTSLSADPNPVDTEGAMAQGAVAISEDGSHIYFATLGQLIPGKGKTFAENNSGLGSANIYLAEDGELSYVTTLGGTRIIDNNFRQGDLLGHNQSTSGFIGGALMRKTKSWAATTSADGRKLAFVAAANLIGYESGGAQEAYLYSADTGEISCISCRPDGLPSVYTPDANDMRPPLSRMPGATDLIGYYRPRAMSEDGRRIFFTSPNVLAPGGAVANADNVYEWEDGQVYFLAVATRSGGGGLGQFLDSTPSGDDVFIATSEQLAPQDTDLVSDVYDFRVGGGFAPDDPQPTPCDPAKDQCQGPSSPPPALVNPPSAGFTGSGNPATPTEPKCRKGFKKKKIKGKVKCVKDKGKPKHKRAAHSNRGGAK